MIHKLPVLGVLAVLSASISGCFFSTSDPPPANDVVVGRTEPSASSTLVIDWTIAGLTDPNECIKAQAQTIEISITDANGAELAAYEQTCTAFSTSITLNPGSYSAFAVLLDAAGQARTTDVAIAPFTLRGNDSLTIPVDFPSDSFR